MMHVHAHLTLVCAYGPRFGLRVRISFCAHAFYSILHMRNPFWAAPAPTIILWYARAYLILSCAYAIHFGPSICVIFWYARAHFILGCACASRLGLRMRISLGAAHAHLILLWTPAYHFGNEYRTKFRLNLFHINLWNTFEVSKNSNSHVCKMSQI